MIKARNTASTADKGRRTRATRRPWRLERAEGQLTGVLTRFMALGESYPDLKANQNMLALQEELTSTENKVAFAGRPITTRSWSTTPSEKCSPR